MCQSSYPTCPEDGWEFDSLKCHHPNPYPRRYRKNRASLPTVDTTAGRPLTVVPDGFDLEVIEPEPTHGASKSIHDHAVAWVPHTKRGTVPVLCSAYIKVLEDELRKSGADSLTFDLLKTAASRLP